MHHTQWNIFHYIHQSCQIYKLKQGLLELYLEEKSSKESDDTFPSCIKSSPCCCPQVIHKNVTEAFAYPEAHFQKQKDINLQPNLFGDRHCSEISLQSQYVTAFPLRPASKSRVVLSCTCNVLQNFILKLHKEVHNFYSNQESNLNQKALYRITES